MNFITDQSNQLVGNYVDIYSTHNEGKSVVAEKFIRNLKDEMNKYTTSISKNMYIDKPQELVRKYNTTTHTSIKTETVSAKSNTH